MLPSFGLMLMGCLSWCAGAKPSPGVQQGADWFWGDVKRLAGNPSPFPSLLDLGQLLCYSGQQGL